VARGQIEESVLCQVLHLECDLSASESAAGVGRRPFALPERTTTRQKVLFAGAMTSDPIQSPRPHDGPSSAISRLWQKRKRESKNAYYISPRRVFISESRQSLIITFKPTLNPAHSTLHPTP